jgi:Mg/Co/Ni transporter MgtE
MGLLKIIAPPQGSLLIYYNKNMYKSAPNQTALFLAEKFIATDPGRAAYFLETLSLHEAVQILLNLKSEYAQAAAAHMCAERAALILRRFPVRQASHVMSRLNPAHSARIMSRFPEHYRVRIEAALPKYYLKQMSGAAAYKAGSAGSLMQSGFFAFKTDDKVKDITEVLKNLPKKKLPSALYVLDKNAALAGIIKTGSLLFFKEDASAGSVMLPADAALAPGAGLADAKELFKKTGASELPVVNKDGSLAGVLELNKILEERPRRGRAAFWVIACACAALLIIIAAVLK